MSPSELYEEELRARVTESLNRRLERAREALRSGKADLLHERALEDAACLLMAEMTGEPDNVNVFRREDLPIVDAAIHEWYRQRGGPKR
jgi:hypothetical protein